jgi:hypothetical protein
MTGANELRRSLHCGTNINAGICGQQEDSIAQILQCINVTQTEQYYREQET